MEWQQLSGMNMLSASSVTASIQSHDCICRSAGTWHAGHHSLDEQAAQSLCDVLIGSTPVLSQGSNLAVLQVFNGMQSLGQSETSQGTDCQQQNRT